jgi:D-3-phosphoglycerate dehydrogenase
MKALCIADFDPAQLAILREHMDVTAGGWGVTGELMDEVELRANLVDADILIVGYEPVSAATIAASPKLSLIASTRGGPDANIDVAEATRRGIPVTYTIGREAIPVADFTFGLIIGLLRHIYEASTLLQSRVLTGPDEPTAGKDVRWGMSRSDPWLRFQGHELAGKTLGIVGVGSVGREVAKRAAGFDMTVLGYDPNVRAESVAGLVEMTDLETLVTASDIVSLHARVGADNRGMIGASQLALMKPTAYLINTARAALVQEEALYDALTKGVIAGAALDIFHREPLPQSSPLLGHPNVLVTPHIAGSSFESIPRHSASIVDSILTWKRGERPGLVFNPDVYAQVSGGGK